MIVKVLKHKTMADTYGHVVHLGKEVVHIWPTNVPELFPPSASLETLKELHRSNKGEWQEQIDNYEMVEGTFTTIS
jgi:hypothetical protein